MVAAPRGTLNLRVRTVAGMTLVFTGHLRTAAVGMILSGRKGKVWWLLILEAEVNENELFRKAKLWLHTRKLYAVAHIMH